MNKIKKYSNSSNEVIHQIRKSAVVIFFLTDSFIKSKRFKFELDYANAEKKPRIYVSMNGNIEQKMDKIDLNNFTTIRLIEPLNSETNKNALESIRILLFNGLDIEKRYYDKNMTLDFSLVSIKQMKNLWPFRLDNINIISSCEVIIKDEDDSKLKVFNFNTSESIGEIIMDSVFLDYCWLEHLNQIFILNVMFSLSSLFTKSGKLIKNISIDFNFFNISSLFYNQISKDLFICYSDALSEEEEFGKTISVFDSNDFSSKRTSKNKIDLEFIKFSNDNIFIWDYSELFIYDLNFNKLTSFELETRIRTVLSDPLTLVAFIETDIDTVILNTKNFSILGSFKHSYIARFVYNKNLVLSENLNLFIYKINLAKNIDDSKYTCKVDQLNDTHLYKKPYFLPCGNSGCFNCICRNFNIFNNNFKCDFKSCQREHKLQNKLGQNFDLENLMLENTANIFNDISTSWTKIQEGNYLIL